MKIIAEIQDVSPDRDTVIVAAMHQGTQNWNNTILKSSIIVSLDPEDGVLLSQNLKVILFIAGNK